MAGEKFDILFTGELMPDADPEEARHLLQQRFKLSDEAVATLFSGRTVTIRRDVDTATAARFREVFREAKALIQVCPVEAETQDSQPSAAEPAAESPVAGTGEQPTGSETESEGLRLATSAEQESKPLEQPAPADPPDLDTSGLHLVPGQNWTLEDCLPPQPPPEVPDTSHLELVTPPPDSGEERGTE